MAKRVLKGLITVGKAAELTGKDKGAISRAMTGGTLDYAVSECEGVRLVKRSEVVAWSKGARRGRPAKGA